MTSETYLAPIWQRMSEEERYDIPRCDICMKPKPAKRITYVLNREGERCAVCDVCQTLRK